MKKYILILITAVFYNTAISQVLYNETFDNYPLGDLTTDPTGITPGLGNWYVYLDKNTASEVTIVQESNKGKVLVVKNAINYIAKQKKIQTVWSNRTTGNNVLLVEYDLYAEDLDNSSIFEAEGVNSVLTSIRFITAYNSTLQINESYIQADLGTISKKYLKNLVKKWITIQVYADYNSNKHYIHIPALGINSHSVSTKPFTALNVIILRGGGGILTKGVITNSVAHKYDNIKVTALKAVPPHVLSAENFLAEKFNVFPNPATNVVNITNAENMFVNQVTVYDIAGKEIKKQTYTNETNIQLNVENLASGTYMLHLQTNEGLAVKKLVKK